MVRGLTLFIFMLVLLSSGCSNQSSDYDKPNVMVSILPQKYFVERIADTLVNVSVMVPPGSSPETYEPTPVQIKTLSNSLAYFSLGLLDFEKTTLKKIQGNNTNTRFINHSKEFNLIEGQCIHHDHSHSHGFDPHVWLSPVEVKKIVNSIYTTLSEIFPMYDSVFKANTQAFIADIDSLDSCMKNAFKEVSTNKFFIFHPAFTYFARDYGLVQVSLEEDGKSPSMKHMKSVLNDAVSEGVKTIFIQKEFDASMAKTIADDIGGRVVVVDPLDYNWLSNMFITADLIKDALNGN
jgi:zinc transport system substrate-binding protein